jgi:hypothetical protein
MGRGRAKAKQTKVARDLKYRTHETDFGALARELHGGEDDPDQESDQESDGGSDQADHAEQDDPDGDYTDEYADPDTWSDYSEVRGD